NSGPGAREMQLPRSKPPCKAVIVLRAASGDGASGSVFADASVAASPLLSRSWGAKLAWRTRTGRPIFVSSVVLTRGSVASESAGCPCGPSPGKRNELSATVAAAPSAAADAVAAPRGLRGVKTLPATVTGTVGVSAAGMAGVSAAGPGGSSPAGPGGSSAVGPGCGSGGNRAPRWGRPAGPGRPARVSGGSPARGPAPGAPAAPARGPRGAPLRGLA